MSLWLFTLLRKTIMPKYALQQVVVFWIIAAMANPLYAAVNIVNIETLRAQKITDGLEGSFNISTNKNEGNTETAQMRVGVQANYLKNEHESILQGEYNFGTSRNETNVNNEFIHFRHGINTRHLWGYEGFLQHSRDEFTRMSFRGLAGGGLRLRLRDTNEQKLYIGAGGFYSHEELTQVNETTDKRIEQFFRGNFYLSIYLPFWSQFSFTSTTYFQPKADELDDYRLLEQAELEAKVNHRFSVSFYYTLSHDNKPPQQVGPSDASYGTSAQVKF